MKRSISLALVCVLLAFSLALTACDIGNDVITDTETKPVTEKQTDTETETEASKEPVPVDSLGGKNPKQLFLQFYDEYTQSKGYDITMTSRMTEEGVTSNQTVTVKVNETSIYVYMKYDEEEMKIWYVDGIMYTEMDGEKVKTSNSDIDDIFGDGFIEQISSTFPDKADLPQTYLDKLEKAQLYSYDGLYYCTVNVTDSEAQEMGEEKGYKETLYFDANGKLKKAVDEAVDVYQCLVLTSYGTTVVINAPADAHKFVDMDNGGNSGGDNDPQAYAKYTQVCDAIAAADVYELNFLIDEQVYMDYATDGQNQYLGVYENNSYYSIWKIGNTGYASVDNGTPVQSQLTEDVLGSFSNASTMKNSIAEKLPNASMSDLRVETSQGETIISFSDSSCYYTYVYDDEFTFIQVTIESVSGQDIESITYIISIIDDPNFQITRPI